MSSKTCIRANTSRLASIDYFYARGHYDPTLIPNCLHFEEYIYLRVNPKLLFALPESGVPPFLSELLLPDPLHSIPDLPFVLRDIFGNRVAGESGLRPFGI